MTQPDPRENVYRPDLADERLRGLVEADRFVMGQAYSVAIGRLSVRAAPLAESQQISELLYGEAVMVFETGDHWAWLQNESDGYVGYVEAAGLAPGHRAASHSVSALRTCLYAAPDLKSPVVDLLSMNSPLAAERERNGFIEVAGGGWVWAGHAATAGTFEHDHGDVALRFLGAPYLWGGRSSMGLDCSGLVQMALMRCGKPAPRDSDMQEERIGEVVAFDGDEAALQSGDLVFWPGHVGIWLDRERFVHANAAHMATAVEPLAEAIQRIAAARLTVSAVRRP